MTDIELTKLCGDAMGYKSSVREDGTYGVDWDPLHNDATLLQLARKFPFEFEFAVIEWCNHLRRREHLDLNRYFCSRIAEKQHAKN